MFNEISIYIYTFLFHLVDDTIPIRWFFRRQTQRNPNFLNWYFVIGLGESGICIANSNELCLSGKAAQLDTTTILLSKCRVYCEKVTHTINQPLTTIFKKKIPWNQFHEVVIVLFEFQFPWMHKIFWNFTKKKQSVSACSFFQHQTLMIWNRGSKGTKTPFHTEVLPLS